MPKEKYYGIVYLRLEDHKLTEEPFRRREGEEALCPVSTSLEGILEYLNINIEGEMKDGYVGARVYELNKDGIPHKKPVREYRLSWVEGRFE